MDRARRVSVPEIPPEERYPLWRLLIIPVAFGLVPVVFFVVVAMKAVALQIGLLKPVVTDPHFPDSGSEEVFFGLATLVFLTFFAFWSHPRETRRGVVAALRGALRWAGLFGVVWMLVSLRHTPSGLLGASLVGWLVFPPIGAIVAWQAWRHARANSVASTQRIADS